MFDINKYLSNDVSIKPIIRPIYIFDLDGTLALTDHRNDILASNDKDKWDKYFEACDKDTVNVNVALILNNLLSSNNSVRIFTGRSEKVRGKTCDWLQKYVCELYLLEDLRMRKEGDFRPDYEIKKEWYFSIDPMYRNAIVAVFEDRKQVVDMWRSIGVTCLQVAEGEF